MVQVYYPQTTQVVRILGCYADLTGLVNTPAVTRKERKCSYRVPHLPKRHIRHIVYFDNDVILAVHVGQVLAGRHFLGHQGNVTFDKIMRTVEARYTPNTNDVPKVKLSRFP